MVTFPPWISGRILKSICVSIRDSITVFSHLPIHCSSFKPWKCALKRTPSIQCRSYSWIGSCIKKKELWSAPSIVRRISCLNCCASMERCFCSWRWGWMEWKWLLAASIWWVGPMFVAGPDFSGQRLCQHCFPWAVLSWEWWYFLCAGCPEALSRCPCWLLTFFIGWWL